MQPCVCRHPRASRCLRTINIVGLAIHRSRHQPHLQQSWLRLFGLTGLCPHCGPCSDHGCLGLEPFRSGAVGGLRLLLLHHTFDFGLRTRVFPSVPYTCILMYILYNTYTYIYIYRYIYIYICIHIRVWNSNLNSFSPALSLSLNWCLRVVNIVHNASINQVSG